MRYIITIICLAITSRTLFAQGSPEITNGNPNATYRTYKVLFQLSEYGMRLAAEQGGWMTRKRQPCSWSDTVNLGAIGNGWCFTQILLRQSQQTGDAFVEKQASEIAVMQRQITLNLQTPVSTAPISKTWTTRNSSLSREDAEMMRRIDEDRSENARMSDRQEAERINARNQGVLRDIRQKLEDLYQYLKTRL